MDAADVQRARAPTKTSRRTAKSCGPDPPTLGSSLPVTNRQATAARKPGAPRRSRISRKTIAQGVPDCFGCPVVACVRRVHFSLHARPSGAASIRHSLRPLLVEGDRRCKTRADRAAGMRRCVHAHRRRPPARPGDPVRRGLSALALASLEYWIARSRLRQGFGVATISRARRSFSEGGEPGDDNVDLSHLTEPPTRNSRASLALLSSRLHCYRPPTKKGRNA